MTLAARSVSARRNRYGSVVACAGLAACTATVAPLASWVTLAEAVLLYLVPVVAAAAVGGLWPGLAAVAGATLAVNFFFLEPQGTFVVNNRDNIVVLGGYALVAATIATAVEIAARHRACAARRDLEARLLAQATGEPAAGQSLSRLLDRIRAAFEMSAAVLVESDSAGGRTVARAGDVPATRPHTYATADTGLRLAGWGPELTADDRLALARLTGAAARTLEAQRLAGDAARAVELAATDAVRAALLAAVGHDLRTPLAGIKAAVSSLRQTDLDLSAEARTDLLATVEASTDRLTDIVENLLAASRLEAGTHSVHLRPVAVAAVVARAVRHATGTGAVIEVDVPDRLPLARTDDGLLERVLVNLINNAVAAGPPGEPVRISAIPTGERIRLLVIDRGPGVPAADRERMFRPFHRPHDHGPGGLGLGLTIARGFAEATGAVLAVEDTPGGGLTMAVSLPLAVAGVPS